SISVAFCRRKLRDGVIQWRAPEQWCAAEGFGPSRRLAPGPSTEPEGPMPRSCVYQFRHARVEQKYRPAWANNNCAPPQPAHSVAASEDYRDARRRARSFRRRKPQALVFNGLDHRQPNCYHFATQLGGTRRNRLVWRLECVLGPKTLIRWHATERAGMAKSELAVR